MFDATKRSVDATGKDGKTNRRYLYYQNLFIQIISCILTESLALKTTKISNVHIAPDAATNINLSV